MRISKAVLTSLFILIFGFSTAYAVDFQVSSIYDGDTLTLKTGEKVRFLQIDTPELSPSECYGAEARRALVNIIGKSSVTLESDPISDDVDRFGRILRYVKINNLNVNLKLVELGAATPYFYAGEKGKYSEQLLKAAQNAKARKIGLWKSCPNTKLQPLRAANTGAVRVSTQPTVNSPLASKSKCDPNYLGCIPPFPPDLDCSDIKKMDLAPIRVIGIDVHKFDGDGDGIGCDK